MALIPVQDSTIIKEFIGMVEGLSKDEDLAVAEHAIRTLRGLQSTLNMLERKQYDLINQAI